MALSLTLRRRLGADKPSPHSILPASSMRYTPATTNDYADELRFLRADLEAAQSRYDHCEPAMHDACCYDLLAAEERLRAVTGTHREIRKELLAGMHWGQKAEASA